MKILFVTYGGGHADMVARIVVYFKQFKNISCQVLALTTASVLLKRNGIEYKTCSDYLNVADYRSAMVLGDELSSGLWHPSSGIDYGDSCAYLGVSMNDLINDLGMSEAKKKYSKLGRKSFLPIRFMGHVLNVEAPDIVVTTCSVRMERAAIIAANRKKIPNILIDDLFGYSLCGLTSIENCNIDLKSEHLPNYIFVLNQFVKNRLIKERIPSSAIFVTGQPVFSNIEQDINNLELEEKYVKIKNENKLVVTYAAPGKLDVLKSQLKQLKNLIAQNSDIYFIIKMHPSTSMTPDIQYEVNSFAKNSIIIHKADVLQSLKISDVVIVYRSTVGLQAIFARKNLIIWGDKSSADILPYNMSKFSRHATSLKKLNTYLVECLEVVNNEIDDDEIFFNTPGALKKIHESIELIYESRIQKRV